MENLKISLQEIEILHYRNIKSLKLKFGDNPILIIGKNGSGKTNILESISLLIPGRGLRNAKFADMKNESLYDWSISYIANSKLGKVKLDAYYDTNSKSRNLVFNNNNITSTELENFFHIVWITPQIENIFSQGGTNRKNFFDRIVYNFKNTHRKNMIEYDLYSKKRLQILKENISVNYDILNTIEDKMSKIAVQIIQNRKIVTDLLQEAINQLDIHVSKPNIYIYNTKVEDIMNTEKSIAQCKKLLLQSRKIDQHLGKNTSGICHTDFQLINSKNQQDIKNSSTGEQKIFLLSILLAQIDIIIKYNNIIPILLLDEFFVHLDDEKKQYMIDHIIKNKMQVFITSTDLHGIEKLAKIAQIVQL